MLHRKPHVVVFYGGSFGNEDLSTETGQWVCEYIPRSKYQVTPVEVTQDGKWKVPLGSLPTSGAVARVMQMLSKAVSPLVPAKALERLFTRPVDAFVSLLRGKGGDDGAMQSLGQSLHIPVLGSSLATSQKTFDKHVCEHILQDITSVPYSKFYKQGEAISDILEDVRSFFMPPLFVKPSSQEGSVGVEEIQSMDELAAAISHAKSRGDIIIQEKQHGLELAYTLVQDRRGNVQALPPTVITPKASYFYDHLAKRRAGRVNLSTVDTCETPAIAEAEAIARDVYDELGCAGIVQIDMMAGDKGVDTLEVNTIPVLTELTPLKQQLKRAGLHPSLMFDDMIARALEQGAN